MFHEFPKWKYIGGTGAGVIVESAEEELALEGEWFDTPWEAAESASKPSADRDELIAYAESAGIKIDKRWSDDKIAQAIKDAE